jgi:regulator of replication initiation timing
VRALELRILELEKANAGLGDRGIGADITRLERMMEGERGERRKQVDNLQKETKSLENNVAVLSSENEGLRGRLNKLIMGQVRNLRD